MGVLSRDFHDTHSLWLRSSTSPCAQLLPEGVDFWSYEVEGGGVLARPDVRGLYLLNCTAWGIWRRFCENALPEDAAISLAATFGISYEHALRDVKATFAGWQETLFAAASPAHRPFDPKFNLEDSRNYFPFYCRVDGTSFHILLSSRELVDEIVPRLQSLLTPAPESPAITFRLIQSENCVYIFSGDEHMSTQEDSARARVVLLQEIVRRSKSKRDFLAILHAGACGLDAKCVIFPAATHSGKTTLAAALSGAGLTLYADDSVALERETLRVPSMPFALMVREGSWPVIAQRVPGFEELPISDRYGENVRFLQLGRETGIAAANPCAVVLTQWHKNASYGIERLTTLDALLRLKECGFWLAHDSASIQTFLEWLQRLPIFEMVYADVDEAVGSIKTLLRN